MTADEPTLTEAEFLAEVSAKLRAYLTTVTVVSAPSFVATSLTHEIAPLLADRLAQVTAAKERAEAQVERVRAVLLDHPHDGTCDSLNGDRPCSCWQSDLRAALPPKKD